jgi:hypothetical protein
MIHVAETKDNVNWSDGTTGKADKEVREKRRAHKRAKESQSIVTTAFTRATC